MRLRRRGDIAGIEQVVPAREIGASYGDAFLAGIGVGMFSGTSEAKRWARPGEIVHPDPVHRPVYDATYGLYRELYKRNAELMRKSGALDRG
jgi:xylulokinase